MAGLRNNKKWKRERSWSYIPYKRYRSQENRKEIKKKSRRDKEEEWESSKLRPRRNKEFDYLQNNMNEDKLTQDRTKIRIDNLQRTINILEDKFKKMEQVDRMMKSYDEKMDIQ